MLKCIEVEESVKEGGHSNTASSLIGMMAGKARNGWEKVKKMVEGKRVIRKEIDSGTVLIVEKTGKVEEELSMRMEWDEEEMGGTVEIEEVSEVDEDDGRRGKEGSLGSGEAWGRSSIFRFLDNVEVEERDRELDDKVEEGRKRKRTDEKKDRKKRLEGLPGWERRSKSVREDEKWKRKVVKWEKDGQGKSVREVENETIPLLERFDLKKESKGMEMNNAGRLKNNFGTNREALFPGGTE
jgi:hypothetical protein